MGASPHREASERLSRRPPAARTALQLMEDAHELSVGEVRGRERERKKAIVDRCRRWHRTERKKKKINAFFLRAVVYSSPPLFVGILASPRASLLSCDVSVDETEREKREINRGKVKKKKRDNVFFEEEKTFAPLSLSLVVPSSSSFSPPPTTPLSP